MEAGAAQALFVAGTVPFILGGAAHVLATLRDTVRPTYFTPVDASVRPAVESTGIRLVHMSGVHGPKPSMWDVWLGVHFSHGLGVLTFGILCLLIAVHDFDLVQEIGLIRPLTIAFSAAFVILSLRFWFYGALIISGSATACFTVAAILSA
jgi:hypothetical protein